MKSVVQMLHCLPLAVLVLAVPAHCDIMGFVSGKGDNCMRRVDETVGLKPECIGAPDQRTFQCPLKASGAKTVHVGIPVEVEFNNTSGDEVLLYWVSDAGAEIHQKSIQPWKVTTQDTFMGHVFLIKSKDGRLLLEHIVGLLPMRTDPRPDTREGNKNERKEKLDKKVEVGLVNREDSVLKLFFKQPSGKLQFILNMEPQTVYPQHTYKGHEFQAYTSDDRLVASAQISDIVVPSCTDATRLDPVVHELPDKVAIADIVNVTECTDCTEKRASRLKIRDRRQGSNGLNIRRLSSRHDEL